MAVKYVKDFDFPTSAGFHSAPKHFAKGGAVKAPASTMKREMTKSNKLSGNGALPRIGNADVNKQSGGAGTKLMPGYKNGGQVQKYAKGGFPGIPGMPGVGPATTRSERAASKARGAALDAENARIAAEEAKPLNRLRKFVEEASADVKQGFKTNIKKPVVKAVATAGPRLADTLSKAPKGKLLAAVAGLLGAGALSMMDDDEAEVSSSKTSSKSLSDVSKEIDEIPVTETRRTESVTAPVKVTKPTSKPKPPMSSLDLVLDYNRKNNPDFDASMEREIRERFSKPSEDGMKRGGRVNYADGGSATYGTTMTPLQRSKMKRGVDPYEDRTRGLGKMTDAEAEAFSKELREKYGKKEKSVVHPGGRQRFLSGQIERAPMKKGGKAESSKEDMKQDRTMMARHNRLMHPDQKSKLKHGGKAVPSYNGKPMIKKAGGGGCNY
ncbi:hypothetical protein UFOVP868_28 [uncultured Caudovirales phage]|uniref:Uncharacterized protein n=1 Tax=uncultured Caudovirales phage TaxID=2100421 RepID=A0A6J5P6T3_9CAUD|nr:hypothetical protein UFOVP868_28 [uncultured Caudovirales phage]